MGTKDWVEIILLLFFCLVTVSIAFIAIPIMEKKKIDVPVWLILLGFLSVLITFILIIIGLCSIF